MAAGGRIQGLDRRALVDHPLVVEQQRAPRLVQRDALALWAAGVEDPGLAALDADLRRLATIGAIRLDCDRANTATIVLLGLLPPCGATVSAVNLSHNSCLLQQQAPCLLEQPALADPTSNPLLPAAATLEKGLKNQEKKKREQASSQPEPAHARSSDQQQPSKPSSPTRPVSRAKGLSHAGVDAEPSNAADPVALLADVLATFRRAAPREWPAPRALTLTPGRRSRLLQALAHAGSHLALQQHLQTALEHIPPWFRSTYPTRPDGSRRPSHQFVDLLFRAAASEREGGPEAWPVFAWSEAALQRPLPDEPGTAGQPADACGGDLERARQLFYWDTHHWCGIGIAALELSLAEKRRLTGLLEASGYGVTGTAERQYAEPSGEHSDPACGLPLWLTGSQALPQAAAGGQL